MTEESGHNAKKGADFFDQFPDEERDKIQFLWEKSSEAELQQPRLNENEVDRALASVHRQLANHHINKKPAVFNIQWKWVAAAAVLLLVAGAGFLLSPKTVRAPRGKMVSLTLPDGSTVALNSGSSVTYNRLFDITNRNIKLNGEAFFSVGKDEDHFIVRAPNATVEVIGTKFNVRSWGGAPDKRTEVTVVEGAVHFYPADHPDKSVAVPAGDLSILSATMDQPTQPKAVTIDNFTGWRDHKLIFNNRSLRFIFRELERRFNIRIQLEARNLARETLTAYYDHPKKVEPVLKDICRVKGLHFSKTTDGYRVYK